ncbi:unnamed protein product [Rhodiola kirilowii]
MLMDKVLQLISTGCFSFSMGEKSMYNSQGLTAGSCLISA